MWETRSAVFGMCERDDGSPEKPAKKAAEVYEMCNAFGQEPRVVGQVAEQSEGDDEVDLAVEREAAEQAARDA